ncbi:MAG: hypothetical protein K6F09_00655, partial [Clostridiales bacterium]|nr:hypothetical protein [Clostridiales bacterium]
MRSNIHLPDVWGQGQIFAYSGLEGECSYHKSLCGTLMADCLGVKFRNLSSAENSAYFAVKLRRNVFNMYYKCVTSDMICAKIQDKGKALYDLDILFVNQNTILIRSQLNLDVNMFFDYDVKAEQKGVSTVYRGEKDIFTLSRNTDGGGTLVSISYGEDSLESSLTAFDTDCDKLIESRVRFYENLPRPCFKDVDEEKLYYKCFSLLRSTVYTPEGKISYYSLTPDRFPHRAVWLWDVAYLIAGVKYMSCDIAKEAIHAILQCAHEDGFLPHMTTPDRQSEITQPPVLAWAAWNMYKFTDDRDFLAEVFDKLAKYVEWDIKNRDINGNGLPEWVVTSDPFCRCDESGLDNTPRFDDVDEMDCIDFASFLANDMRYLSKIAEVLGRDEDKKLWNDRFNDIKDKINTLLWDEEDGFYYDRKLSDGEFHKVKSAASFMPLFAGVCDGEKAKRLVEHLNDPKEFNTPFPIPTISADDKTFPTRDMFRGTVWFNFNYLIEMGLRDYGYEEEAKTLREKTVKTVKHWYINDGVIYEFYDSLDEFSPSRLSRKGPPLQPYMPEIRYQAIRDFSWGACTV